jgi:restriction system protein
MAASKEAERTRKAYERALNAEEKERKLLYVEARAAEAEERNEWLTAIDGSLEGLLAAALAADAFVDLDDLREDPEIPLFQAGVLAVAEATPVIENFLPAPPSGIAKVVPGAGKKHARAVEEAKAKFEEELAAQKER